MKLLKQALTLVLSLSMMLSLLCLGAVAAPDGAGGAPSAAPTATPVATTVVYPSASTITDFADISSITHADAVALLVSLGVINGIAQDVNTVNYQPASNLTRAQAAKIMAVAMTFLSGDEISGTTTFSDSTAHWAADYISYCADASVIDGMGNGTFAPEGTLTGYELAKMLLASMGVSGLTGSDWKTVTASDAATYGLTTGVSSDLSAAINRDNAAQMIYNAMTSAKNTGAGVLPNVTSALAGKIEITALTYDKTATDSQALTTVSSVTYRTGLELHTVALDAATQNATFTVDGVEYNLVKSYEAGTLYSYKSDAQTGISLTTKGDAQMGMGVKKFFQGATQPDSITYYTDAAAWVTAAGLQNDYSVLKALSGGTTNNTSSTGTTIVSKGGFFNGYYISGATYAISGLNMTLVGNGGDDFQGWGAGIMATDGANVSVDKSYIDTTGTVRTAIWAGGKASNLKVTNTVVVAHNNDDATAYSDADNYAVPMLERTPFVLGLNGDIRATNVLGSATASYTDSIVVSNVWGALSTDSGVEGTKALDVSNVLAGIGTLEVAQTGKTYTATKEVNGVNYGFTIGKLGERSGYVTYSDAGVYDIFNNVSFYAPDYIGIIAAGSSALYMNDSYGYSARTGFMIHQNQGTVNPGTGDKGGLYVKGGSYDVADTFVNVRGGLVASSYTTTNINVDGAKINLFGTAAQSGVLLRLMQSDDAGNPGITQCPIENATYDEYKSYDVTQVVSPTTATFSNMTVDGDIYNSVYKVSQILDVTLDKMTITGMITSGVQTHVDANGKPFAGTINASGDDYLFFGRVATAAYPAVNNPVVLTMKNSTTWNVTGTSYLTSLTFDATSKINGTITVDGKVVTAAGTYTGNIVVTAAK